MATTSGVHGEDDDSALNDYVNDDDPSQMSMQDVSPSDSKPGSQSLPMQKRRRVGRACDECRRKKIKCDGKQPCTHCTVYSYGRLSLIALPLPSPPSSPRDRLFGFGFMPQGQKKKNHTWLTFLQDCTYDQPSNRRRNPAPQYVEALEARMHKAETLLRSVLPDLNLDDPQLDLHATEQRLVAAQKDKQSAGSATTNPASATAPPPENAQEGGEESLLETMVDNSGCLDRDDQGHWDYHGHTSGIIFVRRLRKQLGAADVPINRPRGMSQMLESPKSVTGSPQDQTLTPTHDLPTRDIARRLCHNAIDHACSLMRFVHEPSFFAALERVYDVPPEQYTNEENSFIPLLYIVMAVGCLFSDDGAGTLDLAGYEGAIGQGYAISIYYLAKTYFL